MLPAHDREVALYPEQLRVVTGCVPVRAMPLDYVAFEYVVAPEVAHTVAKVKNVIKPRRVIAQRGHGIVDGKPKAVKVKIGTETFEVLTAKVDAGVMLGKVVAVLQGARLTEVQPMLDGSLAGGRRM